MNKSAYLVSSRQGYLAPAVSVRDIRIERGFALSGNDIEDAGSTDYGTF